MGYQLRVRGTSVSWPWLIPLLIVAVFSGLLGMHIVGGHETPVVTGTAAHHDAMASPIADRSGGESVGDDAVHGCADCAEHEAMSTCVLPPLVPAVVPGPPTEDLRVPPVGVGPSSPMSAPADPRPPSLSELCISRR